MLPSALPHARTQRGGSRSTTWRAGGSQQNPAPLTRRLISDVQPGTVGGVFLLLTGHPKTLRYTQSCQYLLWPVTEKVCGFLGKAALDNRPSFPSRFCRRGCTAAGGRPATDTADTPATSLWHLLLHSQPGGLHAAAFPKALEAASPSSRCRQAPCLERGWVEDRGTELCCGGRGLS